MGTLNGTFRFRNRQEPVIDPATGFLTGNSQGYGEWEDGGRCQIDKYIPARQVNGADGQVLTYTYDLFIQQPFHGGTIQIGTELEITAEDGSVDGFTAQGVDFSRKYIEVWG